MNDRYPYRSRSIETSVLHRAFGPQIFGDALHETGLAAAADAADDLDHPVVMEEAAKFLQVVFSGEQTQTGSNLHWSQSFKLRVYWDIHYRLNDLYPPITKIILFPLDVGFEYSISTSWYGVHPVYSCGTGFDESGNQMGTGRYRFPWNKFHFSLLMSASMFLIAPAIHSLCLR